MGTCYSEKTQKPLVFISYSSKDKDIADQLVNILNGQNIDVWIDHEQIKYSDSILNKISKGLEWSSALLFLVSDNSINSNWCKLEYETKLIEEIQSDRTLVIPILIGEPKIPILLSNKKYLKLIVSPSRKIIYEKDKFDELISVINQQTFRGNLISLISDPIVKKNSLLIVMIIASVLHDFPADSLAAKRIVEGKHMGELYRVITGFIEQFESLVNEVMKTIQAMMVRRNVYDGVDRAARYKEEWVVVNKTASNIRQMEIIDLTASNRRLSEIQANIKSLASSLEQIKDCDPKLKIRFGKISEMCVEIYEIENIILSARIKFNIKDKAYDINTPFSNLKSKTSYIPTHHSINYKRELSQLLDDLYQYKTDLKDAFADALLVSE